MIELDFEKTISHSKEKFVLKINLSLPMGNFISIFGKSGVGKTTILRIIAGLQNPDRGRIVVGDKIFFDSKKKICLPIQKRKIGFVFQNYALFPHLNVYQNIVFGQKEDSKRVFEVISLMELEKFLSQKVNTLSGGQAQRVALARALVSSPDLLLLDEPLSAIDEQMRLKLQEELRGLIKHFNMSAFLVSHDISEVFRLSDKIVCIQDGRVSKIGTPDEVFLNERLSGKIQINGQILRIQKSSIVFIADILVNSSIIKVVLSPDEVSKFKIGDCVAVVTKAFNPSIVLL